MIPLSSLAVVPVYLPSKMTEQYFSQLMKFPNCSIATRKKGSKKSDKIYGGTNGYSVFWSLFFFQGLLFALRIYLYHESSPGIKNFTIIKTPCFIRFIGL
jgi:hypothetical protein